MPPNGPKNHLRVVGADPSKTLLQWMFSHAEWKLTTRNGTVASRSLVITDENLGKCGFADRNAAYQALDSALRDFGVTDFASLLQLTDGLQVALPEAKYGVMRKTFNPQASDQSCASIPPAPPPTPMATPQNREGTPPNNLVTFSKREASSSTQRPSAAQPPGRLHRLNDQRLAPLLFGTKNEDRWTYIPPHGEGDLPLFTTDITAAEAKEAGFPKLKVLIEALTSILTNNGISPAECFDHYNNTLRFSLYEHEYHSVRATLKGEGISR